MNAVLVLITRETRDALESLRGAVVGVDPEYLTGSPTVTALASVIAQWDAGPVLVGDPEPVRFLLDGLEVESLSELHRLVERGRQAENLLDREWSKT